MSDSRWCRDRLPESSSARLTLFIGNRNPKGAAAIGSALAGAFEDPEPDALAVAGFRIAHSISWGRHLYVDDLSTLPEARRRGYARSLLDWLLDAARGEGCVQLHLDSGVVYERADAHRLYFNAGLWISAHHFAREL